MLLPAVHSVIPFLCRVMTDNKCALGKLFEETLGGCAVDEEEEGLRRRGESQER